MINIDPHINYIQCQMSHLSGYRFSNRIIIDKKQNIARTRNWTKRHILSIRSIMYGLQNGLTPNEGHILNTALMRLNLIIDDWEQENLRLGIIARDMRTDLEKVYNGPHFESLVEKHESI